MHLDVAFGYLHIALPYAVTQSGIRGCIPEGLDCCLKHIIDLSRFPVVVSRIVPSPFATSINHHLSEVKILKQGWHLQLGDPVNSNWH